MKSLVLPNLLLIVLLCILISISFAASEEDPCSEQKRVCSKLPTESQRKDCLVKTEPHCKAAECAAQILVTCKTLEDKECELKTKCTDEKCKEQIPADPKACDAYSAGWVHQASFSYLIACFTITTVSTLL